MKDIQASLIFAWLSFLSWLKRKWLGFFGVLRQLLCLFSPAEVKDGGRRKSYLLSAWVRACSPATTAELPMCFKFTSLCRKLTSCFAVSCLFLSMTWLVFLKFIFHFSCKGVKTYVDFGQDGEELVLLKQHQPVGCTHTQVRHQSDAGLI